MAEYWICVTCGTQFQESEKPPTVCPICEDDRQYVGHAGQQWTTQSKMASDGFETTLTEEEPGIWSIGIKPSFGIGQRAILLQTAEGNVLWDSIALIDKKVISKIRQLGGIHAIAISHPHFYTAMVDWAREFECPVYLPEADYAWVMRNDGHLCFFPGTKMELFHGITLLRLGGHFPGSSVLHWAGNEEKGQGGVLLTGDTVQVVQDRRWVSFMYSFPNFIPLPPGQVGRIRDALKPWKFERLYSGFAKIESDAAGAVKRSADRYIAIVSGTWKRKYF